MSIGSPITQSFLLIALILTLSACQQNTSDQWRLIYHHDAEGQMLEGDKEELLCFVKQGHPVRIVWPIRNDFSHMMDAGFLTIMQDELYAQTEGIIRQIPNRDEQHVLLDAKEQSRWHAIFSTNGKVHSFQSTQGELGVYRFGLKWFVKGNVCSR